MKNLIRSERGITLMEMMIAVVLIGIIAAMAVPRFMIAVDRGKFTSVNRDIVSTLRMARSQAISEKKDMGVFLDGTNFTMTYYEELGGVADAYDDGTDLLIRVDSLRVAAPCLTDITDFTAVFSSSGSASSGWGCSISRATTWSCSPSMPSFTGFASPLTGRRRWCSPSDPRWPTKVTMLPSRAT